MAAARYGSAAARPWLGSHGSAAAPCGGSGAGNAAISSATCGAATAGDGGDRRRRHGAAPTSIGVKISPSACHARAFAIWSLCGCATLLCDVLLCDDMLYRWTVIRSLEGGPPVCPLFGDCSARWLPAERLQLVGECCALNAAARRMLLCEECCCSLNGAARHRCCWAGQRVLQSSSGAITRRRAQATAALHL